jgi:hypothetical protein
MTRLTRESITGITTRLGALLTCLLLSGVMAAAQAPQADVNTVKSIRTVNGVVEVELHSSREFPIRDEVVVLRIGKKEFLRSRSPEDGSLKTLIFMIDPDQFDSLADGEEMTVTYGRSKGEAGEVGASAASAHRPRWNFGKLNKSLHRH